MSMRVESPLDILAMVKLSQNWPCLSRTVVLHPCTHFEVFSLKQNSKYYDSNTTVLHLSLYLNEHNNDPKCKLGTAYC